MSVPNARLKVAEMQAAFSQGLEESEPILAAIVHVISHGANGDVEPERIAQACRLTINALSSLQDMAMVWHAAKAVMLEVEAP